MRRSFWILTVSLALTGLAASPAHAAPGTPAPDSEEPKSAAEEAAEHYNRGLALRDKARQAEERAAAADSDAAREKLHKKARKHYEKAIEEFLAATRLNPDFHRAFSSLGYAYRKSGDYESALEAYNEALELAPHYSEAIEYRGEAYLGLNRLQDAKQAYLELFRRDRKRAEELLAAMRRWVDAHRGDPATGVDTASLEEFAGWVAERERIAQQSAEAAAPHDESW